MTIALVTGQNATTDGLSVTAVHVAFASNVTTGNGITVNVGFAAALTCAVTSSIAGDVVTSRPAVSTGAGAGLHQAFFIPNSAGGACTITATCSGPSAAIGLNIAEWSGIQHTAAFDSGNVASDAHNSGTSTSPASTSVTPSIAGCLVIGTESNSIVAVASAGALYTLLKNSPTIAFCTVYQIQTTAAATTTKSTIASATWDATAWILQPYTPLSRRTLTRLGTRTGSRQQVG